ncbi:hypothetical protein [Falsibacillus pallidus]|uniref:Uncharacterized protein n=1 Tax=Falsibacillus pallidus TaxID=493781 RepID=A0A370GC09_9BACI|nr:hypothetical protein [Falsibacillus pallidus]RDI39984.1 hypothetical protein DFR59_1135 [Falsibacillus pallidus]
MKKFLKIASIVVLLLVLAGGGTVYYFLKVKKYDVADEKVEKITNSDYKIDLPDDSDSSTDATGSGSDSSDKTASGTNDTKDNSTDGSTGTTVSGKSGDKNNIGSTTVQKTSSTTASTNGKTSTNTSTSTSTSKNDDKTNGSNIDSQDSNTVTVASIKDKYRPVFSNLEAQANDKVKSMLTLAFSEYQTKKENGESISFGYFYSKYNGAAADLEAKTDEVFNVVYGALKNDLKKHGYSTSHAKEFKEQYENEKSFRRSALMKKAMEHL